MTSYLEAQRTRKYELPLSHLEYKYIETCTDTKELEKIIKTLASGDEGSFPDLERFAEERLRKLFPESLVLRKAEPLKSMRDLPKDDQDVLHADLDDWLKDIRRRDSSLGARGDGPDVVAPSSLPPVRGCKEVPFSSRAPVVVDRHGAPKKTTPAPRDARAWDRFDVDAELAKVDAKTPEKSAPSCAPSAAPLPLRVDVAGLTDLEKEARAVNEKNKGNEAFACANFDEAVAYYTRAISVKPTPPFYNNRALAYVKLKKWNRAIEDCNVVLRVERRNLKALLRRAVAYKEKKDFNKSLNDVVVALEVEPHNKRAIELKTQVEEKIRAQKQDREKKGIAGGKRMVIEEESEEEEGEETEQEKEKKKQERREELEEIKVDLDNKTRFEGKPGRNEKGQVWEKKKTDIWDTADVVTRNTNDIKQETKEEKQEMKKRKEEENDALAGKMERESKGKSQASNDGPPPLEDMSAVLQEKFPEIKTEENTKERDERKEIKVKRKGMEDKPAETKDRPKEMKDKQKETNSKQKETKDKQKETKDKQKETKDKQKETKDKQKETKDKQKETQDKQKEAIKPKQMKDKPTETKHKPKAKDTLSEMKDKPKEIDNRPKVTKPQPTETRDKPAETKDNPKRTSTKA